MKTSTVATLASLTTVLASAGTASATDWHITGFGYGLWVTNVERAIHDIIVNSDGSRQMIVTDNTIGAPMDFTLSLPGGTVIDGGQTTSRTLTAHYSGDFGDSRLQLYDWGVWVEAVGVDIHVQYMPNSRMLLAEAHPNGTFDYIADLSGTAHVELLHDDGRFETFDVSVGTFELTGIPTPGAASLLGVAGACALRRRRA